jgi:hypothetical protein
VCSSQPGSGIYKVIRVQDFSLLPHVKLLLVFSTPASYSSFLHCGFACTTSIFHSQFHRHIYNSSDYKHKSIRKNGMAFCISFRTQLIKKICLHVISLCLVCKTISI